MVSGESISTVKGISGKTIRLTFKQWSHIIESHDYMAGNIEKILETVAQPDCIAHGISGEFLAMRHFKKTNITEKTCIVVYRENGDGFIITAFFTTEPERIKKRGLIWQK